MIATILNVIKGTPLWVFGLFFYLLFVGINATKDHAVSLYTASILPLVMGAWSLTSFATTSEHLNAFFPLFLLSFCVGFSSGWYIIAQKPRAIDYAIKTLSFKGTYTTITLLMFVFVIKYAFGYMNAVDHIYVVTYPWAYQAILLLISGIFWGRLLKYYSYFR